MTDPDSELQREKRNKFAGRLLIVALGMLIAAYAAATFLR